jgi:hypothetical protein
MSVLMPAFYRAKAVQFIETRGDVVVGALGTALIKGFSGDHQRQLASWRTQVEILQSALRRVIVEHADGVTGWRFERGLAAEGGRP